MSDVTQLISDIERTLYQELTITSLKIMDESHLHANHPQRPKDKYHLNLVIQSPDLKDLSLLNRHKKIYQILDPYLKTKVHALKINAQG